MAPGGGICKEVIESSIAFADYDMGTSNVELGGSPCRKATTGFGGNIGTTSNNDVHELLQCPVYLNLMYPPTYQCPNGHTLCCHELGNIRCSALEKIAESLELPCRYQILGCQDIFPYYSKLKLPKNCKYRPYSCLYAGAECSVSGDIPLLVGI